MLHGVKSGALGEHPPGKDAKLLARERDLIDFDECGGVRRLGGRARVASTRRDFERAKLDRLIHRNL
jgi:hypothetical protein